MAGIAFPDDPFDTDGLDHATTATDREEEYGHIDVMMAPSWDWDEDPEPDYEREYRERKAEADAEWKAFTEGRG